MAKCACACSSNEPVRLLYACSGSADVGKVADEVARLLAKDGVGYMSCLAGVGAEMSGFLASAREAVNIVIDGCPVSCGRKVFERQGIACTEFILTEMGLVKGSTPHGAQMVEETARSIQEKLVAG